MENKRLLIILDPAHGLDVAGKRSPDGRHRECVWSRERLQAIYTMLVAQGYTVVWTTTADTEPGIARRRDTANSLAARHPQLTPLLVSLHNDASGDGQQWMAAQGASVWIAAGNDASVNCAEHFVDQLHTLPGIKPRLYSSTRGQRSFRGNFGVLMGRYRGVLLEVGFQDNQADVARLQDKAFNQAVEQWVVSAIQACNQQEGQA